MLAQAPSLPIFMGTMSFCVEAAVEAVGGEDALEPGDILLYNVPYGTGSHPQDVAVVMPVFRRRRADRLHGDQGPLARHRRQGAVLHRHRRRLPGGHDLPRREALRRGRLVEDIYRMAIANSRVPKMVAGDINARSSACGRAPRRSCGSSSVTGSSASARPARMFDHGEAVVRSYFEQIPDGRYVGHGEMDSNGVTDDPVPFEVVVEVEGSRVRVDYTDAPDAAGRARSTARCRRPSRRAGSRSPCSPAAASRRTRATSARSRS